MDSKEQSSISSEGKTGFVIPSYATRTVIYCQVSLNELAMTSSLSAETTAFFSIGLSLIFLCIGILIDYAFTGIKNLSSVQTLALYYFEPLLVILAALSFFEAWRRKKKKNDLFHSIKKESGL